MSLDNLYPRVTEAIERAEALDDAKSLDVRSAYLDVSMLEEEIAATSPAADLEGLVARRGAVRAALKAHAFARAFELAERYAREPGLAANIAAELRAHANDANAALRLETLATFRIIPGATYYLPTAA
jgi:hypothetical protein